MSSLPEPKPVKAETMKKIMDKILEDNKNVNSDLNGAVDGSRTDKETY